MFVCLDSHIDSVDSVIFLLGYLFQASDDSFLEKIHQQHAKHPYYVKPKVRNGKFGVKHYAGSVTYEV